MGAYLINMALTAKKFGFMPTRVPWMDWYK